MEKLIVDFGLSSSTQELSGDTFTIIASACVDPPVVEGLVRSDPTERLADYGRAISFWVTLDDPLLGDIILLENSGVRLSVFAEKIKSDVGTRIPKRRVEIISYSAPARPDGIHYCYSEFQMFDALLDHSEFYSSCTMFLKTTGRYIYPNVSKFIRKLPSDFLFVCDSTNIPGFLGRKPSKSAKVGLFVADKFFFDERLRGIEKMMKRSPRHTHVEDLIFDKFKSEHAKRGVFLRYPVNCEPSGVGGNGDDLSSFVKRSKCLVRALSRKCLPFVWV